MRALTSGLNAALTASGAYPGWLVQIISTGQQFIRLCTFDTNFPYAGLTFLSGDVEVPALVWDGSGLRPATITFGDPDASLWAKALLGFFTDAQITLWQAYASAPGEADPCWAGRIGQVTRRGAVSGSPSITFALNDGTDTNTSPRTRIQEIVNQQYLMPAGTVLQYVTGGQVTILSKPTSAAV